LSGSEPAIAGHLPACSSGTATACGMVELRMDARLYGRIDASDVLHDGFLDRALRVDSCQLTRAEIAVVLGITEEAGAMRYIPALKKLKTIPAAMPGGLEGL